jgi:hypothetical protein
MLGLVAAAQAQQQTTIGPADQAQQSAQAGQGATQQPETGAAETGPPQTGAADRPQNQSAQQGSQPGDLQSPNRSLLRGDQSQPAQPGNAGQGQPIREGSRGELGVWLMGTGGQGVEIRRVTVGSAADQAGLRPGDVLMQVNDRPVSSPQEVARTIREIPVGETATLQIWRDGQQQQVSATIAPARQQTIAMNDMDRDRQYEVGFRGEQSSASGDLAQRVMQLERQLTMVTQELRQLRDQMTQTRTSSPGTGGGETGTSTSPETPSTTSTPSSAAPSQPTNSTPGIEQPGTTATPSTTEPPGTGTTQPEAGAESGTEKKSEDDLFK